MEEDMNLDIKRLATAVVAMVIFVTVFILTSGDFISCGFNGV